ncbi:MAG TPA: hypothetical protein VG406_27460 [Isosphaeraceae bacterium]|jgi:hypothetical protein|nr:hypothetical protein [Isosphaeraceae bacterium]
MKRDSMLGDAAAAVVAAGLGLLVTAIDIAAPFGDDSSKSTIVLLFAAGALLGLARPRHPWRWSLLVGIWLPASSALRGGSKPLLLLLVSLAVSTLGAFAGALARAPLRRRPATT